MLFLIKIFIFLVLFSAGRFGLAQSPVVKNERSSGWVQVQRSGLDKAWVSNSHPGHLISFVRHKTSFPLGFSGKNFNEIASGLAGMRELTLQQFGFSDWKLASFDYKNSLNSETIEWTGSYRRPDGSIVQFVEYQFYENSLFSQLTYTIPGKGSPPEIDSIRRKLKSVWQSLQRLPAGDSDLEGHFCEDCKVGQIQEDILSGDADAILQAASKDTSCQEEKSFLFNSEQKSILENLGLSSQSPDLTTSIGRSTLSCFFGAGAGIYGSLRDLVKAVPTLLGMSWNAVKNVNYSGFLKSISPKNLWNSTKKAYEVTASTISSAFNNSTEFIYKSYETGGVIGSVAAVAEAATNLNPSRVVGPFLAKIGAKIAQVVSAEWKGFTCMKPEVMTETVCKVFSYIATDILTGKLAISALHNTAKIAAALKVVRTKAETVPIVGSFLTRNLKRLPIDDCNKIDKTNWMKDSSMSLSGTSLNVILHENKVLSTGVDPKTGGLGCFEVVGSIAKSVRERVLATRSRTSQISSGAVKDVQDDIFSLSSSTFARTTKDFVSQVTAEAGLTVSKKRATLIASKLENDPNNLQAFGDIMRSKKQIQDQLNRLGKKEAAYDVTLKASKSSDALIELIEDTLVKGTLGKSINLNLVNQALNDALTAQDNTSIEVLTNALKAYNKVSSSKPEDAEKSLEAWKILVKREYSKSSSQVEIEKAGACLFGQAGIK